MKTLADSFANLDKCGAPFQAAIAALDSGRDVRRASWPEGMFLRLEKNGLVAIYRRGRFSVVSWSGRDQHDHFAGDWQVLSGQVCPACDGSGNFDNGSESGEDCLNCDATGRVLTEVPPSKWLGDPTKATKPA
ncbi:Thoeris anti-defense Tad2 family protein [Duganella vulcania]|uniref:Thoeris anti-defense 2-like domain-containing protein n=1 Tax=Duganella vulcania TaxID=2692166 RepID=A0A845GGI7_9BURK|nr:hypothetical protein [Duganella vulcania]MYM92505.1 hypothetical protein [Duganella vulcania]